MMEQPNKNPGKYVRLATSAVEPRTHDLMIPFGFPALDAGLWEFFITQRIVDFMSAKRQGMTTGSARYILTMREDPKELATIQVRAFSDQASHISITPGTEIRRNKIGVQDYDGNIDTENAVAAFDEMNHTLLWTFVTWFARDYIFKMDIIKKINIDMFGRKLDDSRLEQLSQSLGQISPSPVGRPRDIDNEWARSEIQKGRDRDEVFEEYLVRQRVKSDDKTQRDRARDRFRKAINRMEGNN